MIKITLQKSPWSLFRGAVLRVGIFKLKPVGESSMCALEGQFLRCMTTTSSEKKTAEYAPHFKDSHPSQHASLKKAAMDMDEYKPNEKPYSLPHPVWTEKEVHEVEVDHYTPSGFVDWMAYGCVQTMRTCFDLISLYKIGVMDESKWLTRIILLETVAGVPGMVAAMSRHFHSLRRMVRDNGWIHTLLEEAENERMHLMTALELKQPGLLFRGSVLILQGIFVNMFFLAYLVSPRFCHRFVGYLEEEAVKTYTYCLECIDNGKLPMWQRLAAPEIAKNYWRLQDDAMMRDVILAIRADEAHHRFVNHTLGSLDKDKANPFGPGQ
ncbi:uncharacterized protein LOC135682036 [Rhopilema esculentum]|uniref:uncharacterized protein LOC135682036 n=1 Tax=Rhopilema esculentum TaxID=499914 RepID=UPI0031DE7E1D|eukprot:gene14369-5417_t